MELIFQVEKQQIYRTDQAHPVADSKNYLTASFSFSEEWTGTKTAIFTADKPYTLQLKENACVVPWEVIKAPGFWVSVYCGDRVTANRAQVYVEESGYQTGETPEPPTPDVYTQLLERRRLPNRYGRTQTQGSLTGKRVKKAIPAHRQPSTGKTPSP